MPALRIRVTPEPFAIRVPSMALTCARVPTGTRASIVRRISTSAKPVLPASTTDSVSILPALSAVIALAASLALVAKSTLTNATRILAKTTALVSTSAVPSAASACQVTTLLLPGVRKVLRLFSLWESEGYGVGNHMVISFHVFVSNFLGPSKWLL